MKARKFIALALASLTALAVTALPAVAETGTTDGDLTTADTTTDTTFELTEATGAALQITVPNEDATTLVHALGSTSLDSLTWNNVAFGSVTVTDTRSLTVGWTATATGSNFCIDQDTSTAAVDCHATDLNQVVPAASIVYDPGTLSLVGGLGDLGDVSVNAAGSLATGAIVTYVGTGNSEITWDATLDFTFLATQVAGLYQGQIYHDVS